MLTVAFLAPGVGGMIGVCEAPLAGFWSGIAFLLLCAGVMRGYFVICLSV